MSAHFEIFTHSFKRNDNVSLKSIVNVLSRNFLADDCLEYLDLHISSVFDDADFVDIFLVPKVDFLKFYMRYMRRFTSK